MRARVAVVVAVLLALLTGCGASDDGEYPPGGRPPPEMILHAQGRVAGSPAHSFCTSSGNVGSCGDGVSDGPRVALRHGRTDLVLRWPYARPNLAVTLTRHGGSRATHETTAGRAWRVTLESGSYELSVFATWPHGDASYSWRLEVR